MLARGNLQSKLTISTQLASFPAGYLPISFRAPLAGAVVFMDILLVDFGVAKYQEMQVRARGARIAKLAEIALSSLQGDIQSVADLGDGHYQLAVYLLNAGGGEPIYVARVAGHIGGEDRSEAADGSHR